MRFMSQLLVNAQGLSTYKPTGKSMIDQKVIEKFLQGTSDILSTQNVNLT